MAPSRFITFEGGEAVGKSTQIELLATRLRERGQQVLVTREPGGTPLGESIRHLLKHAPEGQGMNSKTELLLFLASRAELVRKVIGPALDRGAWVLCDRFLDSTTVYQGVGRGLPSEIVERLNAFAIGARLPGLTLVLDLEPSIARKRQIARTPGLPGLNESLDPDELERRQRLHLDRLEAEDSDFFARVRQGYADLVKAHPERIKVLSANGSVEETEQKIWESVALTFRIHENKSKGFG